MCTTVYARYMYCPLTYLHKWDYCSLSLSLVPVTGKAFRRYRHKTTRCESGRATECAWYAINRKIAEDFGEAALECLQGVKRSKKRRFWVLRGGYEVHQFERVRDTMLDRKVWSATEIKPVVSPGEDGDQYD